MKITIFGLGYVGLVSGACLARFGHEVTGVDIAASKVDMVNDGVSPVVEDGLADLVRDMAAEGRLRATTDTADGLRDADVSFVSVGTPSGPNGALSTDALEAVSASIGEALCGRDGRHIVVYRSTMLPGTLDAMLIPILEAASGGARGDGFDVCYNPEFLREGSSIPDFENPPYTIVGADSEDCFAALETVYAGIDAPFIRAKPRVAESVKYLSNIYHAVKICFANETSALLGALDIDSREAAEIFAMDNVLNVSAAYLRPGFAFGGSCLPKDVRAFLSLARANGVELPMLAHILPSNDAHIARAFDLITSAGRGPIAMFGLAFKSGTDDLRESPLVALAERLIGRGYDIRIFDPNVQSARLLGANKAFIEGEIPHFEKLLRPDADAALDGAETIVIGHADDDTVGRILALGGDAPIFDLQGLERLERGAARRYRGICW